MKTASRGLAFSRAIEQQVLLFGSQFLKRNTKVELVDLRGDLQHALQVG